MLHRYPPSISISTPGNLYPILPMYYCNNSIPYILGILVYTSNNYPPSVQVYTVGMKSNHDRKGMQPGEGKQG